MTFIAVFLLISICLSLTKFDLSPAAFVAQAVEDTRRALFPSIYLMLLLWSFKCVTYSIVAPVVKNDALCYGVEKNNEHYEVESFF